MLFGSSKKAYGTSNIMPGDQPMAPPIAQMPGAVMDPGMEPAGQPRRKVNWGGVLADALAGAAGREGPYLASMQAEQARRARIADEQRQRSMGFDDWKQKQEWQMAHPAPVRNDSIDDFNWFKSLGPEDRKTYQQMHPQYRVGPDGLSYPIAVGGPPASGPLPTFSADDWDKAGGGASNGVGGFPRRR